MTQDPDPHARLTGPAQAERRAGLAGAPDEERAGPPARPRRPDNPPGPEMPGPEMKVRFGLLALSAGGVAGAAALWRLGHPMLAAQLLAGDVLAIFIILLAMRPRP